MLYRVQYREVMVFHSDLRLDVDMTPGRQKLLPAAEGAMMIHNLVLFQATATRITSLAHETRDVGNTDHRRH